MVIKQNEGTGHDKERVQADEDDHMRSCLSSCIAGKKKKPCVCRCLSNCLPN